MLWRLFYCIQKPIHILRTKTYLPVKADGSHINPPLIALSCLGFILAYIFLHSKQKAAPEGRSSFLHDMKSTLYRPIPSGEKIA